MKWKNRGPRFPREGTLECLQQCSFNELVQIVQAQRRLEEKRILAAIVDQFRRQK